MMTTVFRWQDAPEADFAVIGDPIAHSLSPRMHAAAYEALGVHYRYVAVRVPVGQVGRALDRLSGLGYRGVNVTLPHKEAALSWLNESDPIAQRLRACNTLKPVERKGTNTDAPGFTDTLTALGLKKGSRALMIGAGGSARAVASAIDEAGVHLTVYNRTRENATRLISELGIWAEQVDHPDVTGYDLVVNTTSAHHEGAEVHLDWSKAHPSAVAYDLTYLPILTPFLEPAAKAGLKCVDGKPMLVAQGARSLEWWLGVPAPREVMAKAIEP